MIARWNIVIVILLSLQLVNGKAETGLQVSAGIELREDKGEVHSRPKRVGPEPPKTPGAASTGTEAKDMATPVVKVNAPVPEAAKGTVAEPPVPQNEPKVPTPKTTNDTSANGTKANEATGKNITSSPVSNSTANNSTAQAVVIEGPPPYTFPINESERINDAPDVIRKQLGYNIPAKGETHTTNVTGSSNSNSTTNSTSTIESPKVTKESREEMVKMSEKIELKWTKNEPMSGGMVALIASTLFACFAVLGYVGMIFRKRYIAYRQGNSSLLVNDFGTNDTNNYEL